MAYIGFSTLVKRLRKKGIRNPRALAAAIGRAKYGKAAFQKAAARGQSLRGARPANRGRSLVEIMRRSK